MGLKAGATARSQSWDLGRWQCWGCSWGQNGAGWCSLPTPKGGWSQGPPPKNVPSVPPQGSALHSLGTTDLVCVTGTLFIVIKQVIHGLIFFSLQCSGNPKGAITHSNTELKTSLTTYTWLPPTSGCPAIITFM